MDEVKVRNQIRFLLNDRLIERDDFSPSLTLLDFLRLDQSLTGTKEGCAEGDCGACTVLVGRLSQGNLVYEPVNSCIRFAATLDGCHVVTVESLRSPDGGLHPVQQAMVEHHGSQCGFCTPGIVISLYALWMSNPKPARRDVEEALQGNLCRCTGYRPIVDAALAASEAGGQAKDRLVAHKADVIGKLMALKDEMRVELDGPEGQFVIPASLSDFASLYDSMGGATIVSGSTDVGLWVTKFMRDIEPVIYIGGLDDLHKMSVSDELVSIGAGVTYAELMPVIDDRIPQLSAYWRRIGGAQVRAMGSIGGNIANGSPIGDTPPVLIALGAGITLRHRSNRRFMPLENFFIDYGKQNREPGEFVEIISIPYPAPRSYFAGYKISKRRDEDISSVAAGFYVELADGKVDVARIAYGGMAATPLRASAAEKALVGAEWTQETIDKAQRALDEDFTPISDMRASADYRMLVAKNLLQRFFNENGSAEDTGTVEAAE